ncbi:PLP-dependent aminotransferase family protein [Rosenbergiella australiborealis]|uniref:MocR-like pyridoxine biosynthesis transcription factor PdxR n=1 Tax=Rosenbergiella australiborealis TaxID=1544696 RepID=UPI001F4E3660|nr:PLP-dependent aminotransferase family protein [Rosenbergiella australiborealis]
MTQRSSIWLSLTLNGKGSRVAQINHALRSAIEKGHLVSGERLPSTRQLAIDVGCSRVTVEAAYQLLTDQGYIIRQPGRGSYVAQCQGIIATNHHPKKLLSPTLSERGKQHLAQRLYQDPRQIQAFNAGVPDVQAFPTHYWAKVMQEVMDNIAPELLLYGDPQGLLVCRQAVSHYLALSRQVNCSPSQIIMMTSSQQALQLLADLLLDKGDTVLTEALCYQGAVNAFQQAGTILKAQPLDDEGALAPTTNAKLAYLTPGHQYPLGMTMSAVRRRAWLDWAAQQHSWIIEDDYDGEFHYGTSPLPSLQQMDCAQTVIYLGTFSKTLFPAIRLAYMVVPHSLVPAVVKARQMMDSHTAQLTQAVSAEFIFQGYFASHLRLMKRLYEARFRLLIALLHEHTTDYLRILPCEGGLQLAVEYLLGSTEKITLTAARQGLVLVELAPLCLTSEKINGWILGFASLPPQALRTAVMLFKTVLQDASSSH